MSENAMVCTSCQAPNPSAVAGEHCRFCGGELSAAAEAPPLPDDESLELVIEDAEPPLAPAFQNLEAIELLDLPEAVVAPLKAEPPVVPVLKAVRSVPVARASESERPERTLPKQLVVRSEAKEPEQFAKPKVFLALLVLLVVLLAFVLGLSVIVYAVWMGFKSVAKPQAAAAPVIEQAKFEEAGPPVPKVPATTPIATPTASPLPPKIELPAVAKKNRIPHYVPDRFLAIRPPSAEQQKVRTYELDLEVSDTCVAGGGRYWVLGSSAAKKILIFDVNVASVVKELRLEESQFLIAAGMNHLFVYYPSSDRLNRFSMTNHQPDATRSKPCDLPIEQMVMGSASDGPLVAMMESNDQIDAHVRLKWVDPTTLQPIETEKDYESLSRGRNEKLHLRASPDGRSLVVSTMAGSGTSWQFNRSGNSIDRKTTTSSPLARPTNEKVITTQDMVFEFEHLALGSNHESRSRRIRIPSTTGKFYLSGHPVGASEKQEGEIRAFELVQLYLLKNKTAISAVPGLRFIDYKVDPTSTVFLNDKRILFVPEAHLIAVIPEGKKIIELTYFDPFLALSDMKGDYVYSEHRPIIMKPGMINRFALDAKTGAGKLDYKIWPGERLPSGMVLTSDGRVIWDVPTTQTEDVTIKVMMVNENKWSTGRAVTFVMDTKR